LEVARLTPDAPKTMNRPSAGSNEAKPVGQVACADAIKVTIPAGNVIAVALVYSHRFSITLGSAPSFALIVVPATLADRK